MTSPQLILASTSRYRRMLLERLGIAFRAQAPVCDEEAHAARGLAPQDLAETLALAKAASVAELHPQAVVIGSDQVAAIADGSAWTILGKPGNSERAIAELTLLSGRTHVLITAVAVVHGGSVERHTDVTRLRMRPLDRAQIARYVAADQPLDCAGAYKLEARGIALFESITSADHSAITGLPLIAVTSILSRLGFEIP